MLGSQLQLASTFTADRLQSALARGGIADKVDFLQFTQMSEYMLSAAANGAGRVATVVLIRIEDWVREALKSEAYDPSRDAWLRREFKVRMEELVSQAAILAGMEKQLCILACPSNGWISEQHKLAALGRTFTNLVLARLRDIPGIAVLAWPAAMDAHLDREQDRLEQIPYTDAGWNLLAESIKSQIERTLSAKKGRAEADTDGSPALAAYLAGLQVRIQISVAGKPERADVDRLLRTVASFSLTGEKPTISDAEVDAILDKGCVVIAVSDRSADYGVSGLMGWRIENDTFVVDTFALSCTVLGKQVEYAALSAMAGMAAARGCGRIAFEFRSSGRNQPMLAFLQQIADRESETRYSLETAGVESRIARTAVNPGAWSLTQP